MLFLMFSEDEILTDAGQGVPLLRDDARTPLSASINHAETDGSTERALSAAPMAVAAAYRRLCRDQRKHLTLRGAIRRMAESVRIQIEGDAGRTWLKRLRAMFTGVPVICQCSTSIEMRVLVTRPEPDASAFARMIAAGHEPAIALMYIDLTSVPPPVGINAVLVTSNGVVPRRRAASSLHGARHRPRTAGALKSRVALRDWRRRRRPRLLKTICLRSKNSSRWGSIYRGI